MIFQGGSQFCCSFCHRLFTHLQKLEDLGKRNQTKSKLCNNQETLIYVLNNCSNSLNQGRYTWRHNSILQYTLTTIKGLIGSENIDITIFSDLAGYTTTGGTLPHCFQTEIGYGHLQ